MWFAFVRGIAAAAVFILAGTVLPASSRAGDYAFEAAIGFSPDGRYFAFEEYGIEDGSGFPYSNIFVIDLETDTFAPQTPVRLRIDNEAASLADVRAQAAGKARPVLAKYETNAPAVVAYARGLGDFADFEGGLTTEIVARVAFPNTSDPTGPAKDHFDLVLRHIPARSVAKCPLDTIGFQLEKIDAAGQRRFVHKDEKILLSRGCPLKYRISRVYLPAFGRGDYAAILISVFQTGFEGANRRFVVFPVTLG